jgi:hypothetical protein
MRILPLRFMELVEHERKCCKLPLKPGFKHHYRLRIAKWGDWFLTQEQPRRTVGKTEESK